MFDVFVPNSMIVHTNTRKYWKVFVSFLGSDVGASSSVKMQHQHDLMGTVSSLSLSLPLSLLQHGQGSVTCVQPPARFRAPGNYVRR